MEYSLNSTLNNSTSDLNRYNHALDTALVVYSSIIVSIEIPLICAAIYAVFFLTKSGQGAPVFVINLLITDLIQIVCFLPANIDFDFNPLFLAVLFFAYLIGMYFMMCVAVERYLLIVHPIWYRSHHPVKGLVCTSVIGWLSPFIISLLDFFLTIYLMTIIPFIYYAVIVFCFVGAHRALSHSQSVTSIKRRLVLASLFFVLLSYTFTILPVFFSFLMHLLRISDNVTNCLFRYTFILIMLNPIADCVLYVFMRNDVGNVFRTPHCCPGQRRIQSDIPLTTVTNVQSRNV